MNNREGFRRVVLSHSGRQHAYRVASALDRAGELETFYTSSYYKPGGFPDRLFHLAPPVDRWLRKRWDPAIDEERVSRFPLLELPEIACRAMGGNNARLSRLVEARDMRFDEIVAGRLRRSEARIFWGFQGSCRQSVEAARSHSMTGVVEFASVPHVVAHALLRRDMEHALPGEVGAEEMGSPEYRSRVDGEPGAADICVAASSFTAESLKSLGVARERIRVIPLGADTERFEFRERRPDSRLRLLFVGKLGRHKGLRYLLKAVHRLGPSGVTLSLAGPSVGDERFLQRFQVEYRMLGSLDGDDLLRAYHEHDVLVVPSIYDGFGLVIVEGLSTGMPVIATRNSGGPDVIREGADGFIVDAFDSEAIADRIDWLLQHREALREMGRSAAQRAREFSWNAHANRVLAFVSGLSNRPVVA